ncbi:hypothetical protein FACS1894187_00320 [Synergistales bacterium]|nr:hypothetical protein FACS1894187_00320 [Synergistales bacterium]
MAVGRGTEREYDQSLKQLGGLIGSKVEIVITSGLYKGSYSSRLEEVSGGLGALSHPTLRGALLPVLRSAEFMLKIEAPNCFYQAVSVFMRSSVNEAIPLLWFKLGNSLEKVQRRMFVRIPCSVPASVFFLGYDSELPEGMKLPDQKWFDAHVTDISLGGCGLSIKKNMASYYIEGGRYLLLSKISGVNFFIVGKLIKIFNKKENIIDAGFAYDGLAASIEKVVGTFIRQQELMSRG